MNSFDYFSVLVIGENPDDIMSDYDMMVDVEKPYILYKYSDIKNIRRNKIKIYESLLKKMTNKNNKLSLQKEINKIKILSDNEYYQSLAETNFLDENNNIVSNENPNGKWITSEKGGKIYSTYLKDINGNNIVSEKNENIGWDLIHKNEKKVQLYERTWDLCVNKVSPKDDSDTTIIKNMSKYVNYFEQFKNQEMYVNFCSSFFTHAIIINNKWFDMESVDEYYWIKNYYDKFIKIINKNDTVTIYECTR